MHMVTRFGRARLHRQLLIAFATSALAFVGEHVLPFRYAIMNALVRAVAVVYGIWGSYHSSQVGSAVSRLTSGPHGGTWM